ncbi:hypothetical protein M404DRAFT_994846 [Pisolithus tinctorius Marx 270]|uniref:Uncharacterized protein n=1 Tax=Pisolithus tinctorius Marx 270 TaxID=870435 RepID=A0A0C3PBU2_PISTI|nr:hypothetical protein M404DRAFT_994846 [Pisolithus tinctorius Marx 270]
MSWMDHSHSTPSMIWSPCCRLERGIYISLWTRKEPTALRNTEWNAGGSSQQVWIRALHGSDVICNTSKFLPRYCSL